MLGRRRISRVNELIRHELSALMRRELEFDLGTLVTLTRVEVSPDLEHAKAWVSVLPRGQGQDVLVHLQKKIGELQRLLNRQLVMEPVPKIRFLLDHSGARASHIEGLLDSLDQPG
ncbi:MAG: 30S ribosome-binding factor RbfA [Candidatus Kerfeldbacteria bacterium]|nr:30S ribosome-binding factor RbfA [Candidatus Kerfeldbacteria bacterium]